MIFFFYGTDAFRIEEALKAEIGRVVGHFGPGRVEVLRVRPEDEKPERVFEFLQTPGLFGSERLLVIERLGVFRKDISGKFAEYLKGGHVNGERDIAICITHETSEKAKAPREDALVAQFGKKPYHAKRFDVLSGAQLFDWVMGRAGSLGVVLGREAADALIVAHGNRLAIISQELKKLALYLGASAAAPKKAGSEELAMIGWERITQDGFRLVDAMGRKDHFQMLQILLRLFASGEDPVKILGLIVYALRNMLSLKDIEARPVRVENLHAALGMQPWQMQQYRAAASRFSLEDLKKIYERVLTTDYKIKTGEGNPRILLEQFLLRI